MRTVDQEFCWRVSRIPFHGLGLSVDVYSPDIFALVEELCRCGLPSDYLEIFKATPVALEAVRQGLPGVRLPYHAEGLWVTQPEPERISLFEAELDETVEQLRILGSHWVTHECATKQLGGYAFGTYLPALFTEASARVTAENITRVQHQLDARCSTQEHTGPLFLLETPPLTYVGFGEMTIPEFFRLVTDWAPCGICLDVGHLWTVYRYTGEWRRGSLAAFLAEFLGAFPMERVVEVHVAGLGPHPAVPTAGVAGEEPPLWVDMHEARIPEVLLEMVAQVLEHPRLVHLRGLALEVDTKPIPIIVEELAHVRNRLRTRWSTFGVQAHACPCAPQLSRTGAWSTEPLRAESKDMARVQYDRYARIMTGQLTGGLPVLGGEGSGLSLYRDHYLPHEILEWGGAVQHMFPETCRQLERAGLTLDGFVRFWFREPRAMDQTYDFFLLKLARFVEFVREALPLAVATAEREAELLRAGYRAACEAVEAPRGVKA